MQNIRNYTLPEMEELALSMGEPVSRAKQLFAQVFSPGIDSFSQLHNISQDFIQKISQITFIESLTLHKREVSSDGTVKYAFRFSDGNIIESVLIPNSGRNTLCISTQAGCAMGCKFCLTSTMGFQRNLETAEIIGQVLYVLSELKIASRTNPPKAGGMRASRLQRAGDDGAGVPSHRNGAGLPSARNSFAKSTGIINNIVFMGMGEPLDNSENCIKALSILQSEKGFNYSPRKITVSTCGITPEIIKFSEASNVNLAISLHSVDEKVRTELMPINRKYPLAELLDCCRAISAAKDQPILIEYILFQGINDSEEDAQKLAKALRGINCKINLLAYNENPSLPFRQSTPEVATKFKDVLHNTGCFVLTRRSRGSDISAACGQLAGE